MFYRNKLIANVICDVEHAIGLQKMGDHFDIVQFQKNQAIVSVNIEVRVSGKCHFQLFVFFALGDEPAVMDELSSILEVWVHYNGHEIVHFNHLDEKKIERIIKIILASDLLGCIGSFLGLFLVNSCSRVRLFKDVVVLSDSLIQCVISV